MQVMYQFLSPVAGIEPGPVSFALTPLPLVGSWQVGKVLNCKQPLTPKKGNKLAEQQQEIQCIETK